MSILTQKEKSQLKQQSRPFGLADQMMQDLPNYQFNMDSVGDYVPEVRSEIMRGIQDVRSLGNIQSKQLMPASLADLKDAASKSQDPVERDQAIWGLLQHNDDSVVDGLIGSIKSAPDYDMALSALLALQKVSHKNPDRAVGFFEELSGDSNIELAEWARLQLTDIAAHISGHERRKEPVSSRDFVSDPKAVFDTTMPLVFECTAYTQIGSTTLRTTISPTWFSAAFGKAMACIRKETFTSNLVLEKAVFDLHPDGSTHYEHFPFCGTTDQLAPGVHKHNYWAQLFRPFYTSGRTEVVTPEQPVIRDMPMTFARFAATYTPDRYCNAAGPVPESVRGVFFGYGHIEEQVLLQNKLKIKAGDFQLCARINPHTKAPANTKFYGTFFGKVCDWDHDGKLDINTRPVHCDLSGALDYYGDGRMMPDPVCPEDWRAKKSWPRFVTSK